MDAYEEIFKDCSDIPWHIISDQNWYKEHLVASKIKEALELMKLKFPSKK